MIADNDLTAINDMTVGDAAVEYMRLGLSVFPCLPDQKRPATEHGCKDARRSRRPGESYEDVRRLYDRRQYNLGIATGSVVSVLDVDVKNGAPGEVSLQRIRAMGLLGGAVAQGATPSGGVHVYFPGSIERNGCIATAGLDHRGEGGYVVAPPSRINGGSYSWLYSRALTDGVELDWQQVREVFRPSARHEPVRIPAEGTIGGLRGWLSLQPTGNRNSALYWAANRALDSGFDPYELTDVASCLGLAHHEIDRTVESAIRGRHG